MISRKPFERTSVPTFFHSGRQSLVGLFQCKNEAYSFWEQTAFVLLLQISEQIWVGQRLGHLTNGVHRWDNFPPDVEPESEGTRFDTTVRMHPKQM